MTEAKEVEKRIAFLMGQVAVLGIAMQSILKHHPNREEVAVTLHESYEGSISRVLPAGFPEAFLDGMKSARNLYLLKDLEDPGQQSR